MLVVLKIPIVYLGVVVLWAIRAEPSSNDGPETVHAFVPLTPCGWDESRRRRRSSRPAGRRPNNGARRRPIRLVRRPHIGVSA